MTRKSTRRRSSSHRTRLGRVKAGRRAPRTLRGLAAGAAGAAALLGSAAFTPARAQQTTFHLDRVEVPGSPDDGFVLFRPYTRQNTIFFGQLALGYSLNPLHTSDVTNNAGTLAASSSAIIQDQFTTYANVGFEFLDRFTVGLSIPVTWIQDGQSPSYSVAGGGPNTAGATGVYTRAPAADDTRLDLRAVAWRSLDRKLAVGGQLSIFFPTGSNANFGGDGSASALLMVNAEYTTKILVPVTFVVQTGLDFRPQTSLGAPLANGHGVINGLGIGDEWRWAVGGFVPFKKNKYRLGLTIFGQTGIENGNTSGNTVFTSQNTPIEWQVEGRMKFGPKNHWWWGLGGGTRFTDGYGAPDMRIMGLVGAYLPIGDSGATSPDPRMAMHEKWRAEGSLDSDHDGIPDDQDACPNDPEDHKGNDPNDGCPEPADRDGDGIPDQYDKCPDVPEDKDGIDDTDGCPEDDADQDGVPDTQDACPREPGQPSPDPKKNGCPQFIHLEGSIVRVLQQVHFATASTTILPDSFPMLQEIANLLHANPQIRRMSIEGHTDDRGEADMNKRLSDGRANSVMTWLSQHGVEAERLEAHGYGEERPIADNATDEGRASNRRVEFKIVDEDTGPPKPRPKPTTPDPSSPKDEGEIDQ
jgi:outer membrane protein OmpA-like peptidoglycan-associated protein